MYAGIGKMVLAASIFLVIKSCLSLYQVHLFPVVLS